MLPDTVVLLLDPFGFPSDSLNGKNNQKTDIKLIS